MPRNAKHRFSLINITTQEEADAVGEILPALFRKHKGFFPENQEDAICGPMEGFQWKLTANGIEPTGPAQESLI